MPLDAIDEVIDPTEVLGAEVREQKPCALVLSDVGHAIGTRRNWVSPSPLRAASKPCQEFAVLMPIKGEVQPLKQSLKIVSVQVARELLE